MKRSDLKHIVKEIVESEIGKTEEDPKTGIKTTLKNINPETGTFSWDVEYGVDPSFMYKKLEQLVDYMEKVKEGTEFSKIRDIIKSLKNKTHRLMNK